MHTGVALALIYASGWHENIIFRRLFTQLEYEEAVMRGQDNDIGPDYFSVVSVT
jgi:hypothetical protein